MNKKKVSKIFAKAFIYLVIVLLYLPIMVMVVYSFTNSNTMTWNGFSFALYQRVFVDPGISSAIRNTLVIALVSSTLATVIGTLTAYGIGYMRRPFKKAVGAMGQITIVNSDVVTAVAFMLFFITIRSIGIPINDGYATLIIAHTVITIPYVVLSVSPKIRRLNPNLYEAGLDLGAGPLNTVFRVILPQLVSGMVSGFALAFTLSLDDFVITQFNKGTSVNTISTLIYASASKGLEPAFRALSTIIFVTILLALVAFNAIKYRRDKIKSKKH
ncbi:MAG: ABC transporter permease [Firmicutes bacterium]|nr:ABC transporter permease [Bacillota bacterium]